MKLYLLIILFSILKSQTCIIDSLSMTKIGNKELVNGEFLFLYDCSNGHRMWLYPNEEKKILPIDSSFYNTENLSLIKSHIIKKENNINDGDINITNKYSIEVLLHNKLESEMSEKKNESKLDMDLHKIMKDQNKLFDKSNDIKTLKPERKSNSIKTAIYIISGLYLIQLII